MIESPKNNYLKRDKIMPSIFEGLEKLGFKETPKTDSIFVQKHEPAEHAKSPDDGLDEQDIVKYIYLKKRLCPICGEIFTDVVLRTSKCKYMSSDTDLRANYIPLDPIYYDIIHCQFCGYAAMNSHFDQVTDKQKDAILSSVKPQYKYKEYPIALSPEDAMERYQLALLCATIKNARSSEKAVLCLRLAWIARDLRKEPRELEFLSYALQGFEIAYSKEAFPIYGMDSVTLCYLLGELCRRGGRKEDAMRYIGKVLISKQAKPRLKDRALAVKELLVE
jgi:uncharacterized protein (DUF2225 family)